jgi:hypothetical protein
MRIVVPIFFQHTKEVVMRKLLVLLACVLGMLSASAQAQHHGQHHGGQQTVNPIIRQFQVAPMVTYNLSYRWYGEPNYLPIIPRVTYYNERRFYNEYEIYREPVRRKVCRTRFFESRSGVEEVTTCRIVYE